MKKLSDFIKNGWSVIPVSRKGKNPLIKEWTRFCKEMPSDNLIEEWEQKYPECNIGLCCGPVSGIVGFDLDLDLDNPEELEIYEAIEDYIPKAPIEKVGKKGFTRLLGFNGEKSESIKVRLKDGTEKNAIDILANGRQTVIPPSVHPETGEPYKWVKGAEILQFNGMKVYPMPENTVEQIKGILGTWNSADVTKAKTTSSISGRNNKLKDIASAALHGGATDFEVARKLVDYDIRHHGNPLFSDEREPQMKGNSPEQNALRFTQNIRNSLGVQSSEKIRHTTLPMELMASSGENWPKAIAQEGFYGLAGKCLAELSPQTEGDPNAILTQFLTYYGNVVGRGSYVKVGPTAHFANLYNIVVGQSAYARKGTSLSAVSAVFSDERVGQSRWAKNRIKSGASSGEGIVFALSNQTIGGDDLDLGDQGDTGYDIRLLLKEAEFAQPLKVMSRDTNILSAILRDAWDTGKMSILTKNDPLHVDDAHLSMVGHITSVDLNKYLKETEAANGFGNRILWTVATRSRLLPHGGDFTGIPSDEVSNELKKSIEFASKAGEVTKTREADEFWCDLYAKLTSERLGMYGAMTSRAEAQVLRLSLIYALLDRSHVIDVKHIAAAKAVWTYCQASCWYLFGQSVGDSIADKILEAVKKAPEGLSRTAIRDLFGKNKKKEQIQQALDVLEGRGMIRCQMVPGKGSKQVEIWFVVDSPSSVEAA